MLGNYNEKRVAGLTVSVRSEARRGDKGLRAGLDDGEEENSGADYEGEDPGAVEGEDEASYTGGEVPQEHPAKWPGRHLFLCK
jgi:hypothetical protein